ncbi:MAG TPA: orotate phosphoribosyltransferase [Pseudorhodoplanes sp.]|nr:orotate phosphoribosyltransferase [Pseudorhodoplanes sp.]
MRSSSDLSRDFARYLAGSNAVKFGDFHLKSGKRSDIFFNFGNLCSGVELATLGSFFAKAIVERSLHKVDAIFGPAYKGINIAIAASIFLWKEHKINLPVAYNRTKYKEHGEGGSFVGQDLATVGRVLVVDDVITDGLTKYETIRMLSAFPKLRIEAFLIGMDREDTDEDGALWTTKFVADTGIKLSSITCRTEVLQFRDSNTNLAVNS